MTVLASYPELTGVRPVAPTGDALRTLRHTEARIAGGAWRRRQHLSGAATIHHGRTGGPWRLALRHMVAFTLPSHSRALIASEPPTLAAAGP